MTLIVIGQLLAAWLLADLITGIAHWFEDAYLQGQYSLNFLESIASENDLHHKQPTAMLVSSGWTNMRSAAAIGWPLAAALCWFGFPLWINAACFFATFGNLIHRWAHTPQRQLPAWIRGLQSTGFFISHKHHDSHHRSMARLIPKHLAGWKFCAMTDFVNPIVDAVRLWALLEWSLAIVGLKTTRRKIAELQT